MGGEVGDMGGGGLVGGRVGVPPLAECEEWESAVVGRGESGLGGRPRTGLESKIEYGLPLGWLGLEPLGCACGGCTSCAVFKGGIVLLKCAGKPSRVRPC